MKRPTLWISQRLNAGGSRAVAAAIAARNADAIAEIARAEARAGADYLDVNAAAQGQDAAAEPEALGWLVEAVQAATDVPLCLDSVNPDALRHVLPLCRRPPLRNCLSGVSGEDTWALLREWPTLPVIAVCLDTAGTRTGADQRVVIAEVLMERMGALGVGEGNVILDPVTLPSSCGPEALAVTLETLRRLRRRFPAARLLGVPGNFSHGGFGGSRRSGNTSKERARPGPTLSWDAWRSRATEVAATRARNRPSPVQTGGTAWHLQQQYCKRWPG